jgi:putative membrane protein
MRLLLAWLINTVALFAVPYILRTVYVQDLGTALIAALLLGLVNTLIRPILVLLTLPVTLVTLGLFIFIINGLMLWLTGTVSGALGLGFRVEGFWPAFWGALVVSLVSTALSLMMRPPKVVVYLDR